MDAQSLKMMMQKGNASAQNKEKKCELCKLRRVHLKYNQTFFRREAIKDWRIRHVISCIKPPLSEGKFTETAAPIKLCDIYTEFQEDSVCVVYFSNKLISAYGEFNV